MKLLPVVASHSQLGANLIDAIAIASMGVSPGEVPFPALEEEAFQSLPREEPDARCLMSGRGKQVREFLAGIYTNPAEANRVFESLFSHGNGTQEKEGLRSSCSPINLRSFNVFVCRAN